MEKKQEDDCIQTENDDSLERVMSLVRETNKMKEEESKRDETIRENFKLLRDKISSSTHYLTGIKRDIENIKLTYENDRKRAEDLTEGNYLQLCDKTDEEIDTEFRKVQTKLDALEKRVSNFKDELTNDSRTFQETLSETVSTLDNASRGIYNTDNLDH